MISEKEFSRRFTKGDIIVKYVTPRKLISYYYYECGCVYCDMVNGGHRIRTHVPSSMEVVDLYDELGINSRYYSIVDLDYRHHSKRCIQ